MSNERILDHFTLVDSGYGVTIYLEKDNYLAETWSINEAREYAIKYWLDNCNNIFNN